MAPALPGSDDDWSNIFDEGNAAVLLELGGDASEGDGGLELLQPEFTELEDPERDPGGAS